jgi:hypothetical protein
LTLAVAVIVKVVHRLRSRSEFQTNHMSINNVINSVIEWSRNHSTGRIRKMILRQHMYVFQIKWTLTKSSEMANYKYVAHHDI